MGLGLRSNDFKIFGFPGVGSIDEIGRAREMEKMRRLGFEVAGRGWARTPRNWKKPKRKNWDEDELV